MRVECIGGATLYEGDVLDVLRTLPDESVHCCVTSPPYWGLRDYGTATWEGGDSGCDHKQTVARHDSGRVNTDGFHGSAAKDSDKGAMNYRDICGKCGARRIDHQIGLEPTPGEYVEKMVAVFTEVRRVLRANGTFWIVLGDSYAGGGRAGKDGIQKWGGIESNNQNRRYGSPVGVPAGLKVKDLCGIPWMVAFALRADGWYLRSDIIWAKPGPMPESVIDRPTKAHEYIFLLSKSAKYYYDAEAVREEGVYPAGVDATGSLARFGRDEQFVSGNAHRGSKIPVTTGTRNRRSVWTVATQPFPEAHFATFPEKLIKPCILAGCPAQTCPECGAPWMRVVERKSVSEYRPMTTGAAKKAALGEMARTTPQGRTCGHSEVETLGFRPTCDCGREDTVPGVVLDPFAGAGTTAVVCAKQGRRSINIELNPTYLWDIAAPRIRKTCAQPLLPLGEPLAAARQIELISTEEGT